MKGTIAPVCSARCCVQDRGDHPGPILWATLLAALDAGQPTPLATAGAAPRVEGRTLPLVIHGSGG